MSYLPDLIPTVKAYRLVRDVVNDTNALDSRGVRDIHAKMLADTSWDEGTYLSPGETRTSTGHTVVIGELHRVQCCPYYLVDGELDFILGQAKVAFGPFGPYSSHSPGWPS